MASSRDHGPSWWCPAETGSVRPGRPGRHVHVTPSWSGSANVGIAVNRPSCATWALRRGIVAPNPECSWPPAWPASLRPLPVVIGDAVPRGDPLRSAPPRYCPCFAVSVDPAWTVVNLETCVWSLRALRETAHRASGSPPTTCPNGLEKTTGQHHPRERFLPGRATSPPPATSPSAAVPSPSAGHVLLIADIRVARAGRQLHRPTPRRTASRVLALQAGAPPLWTWSPQAARAYLARGWGPAVRAGHPQGPGSGFLVPCTDPARAGPTWSVNLG